MAQLEIDSFVTKFKQLLNARLVASLKIDSINGEANVTLKANIGKASLAPTFRGPTVIPANFRGPSYHKRQIKHLEAFNKVKEEENCLNENFLVENLDTTEKAGFIENENKTLDNVLTAAQEVVMGARLVECVTSDIDKAADKVEDTPTETKMDIDTNDQADEITAEEVETRNELRNRNGSHDVSKRLSDASASNDLKPQCVLMSM